MSSLQSVMDAISGSINTARTYPVKCSMIHMMFTGCVMIVVQVVFPTEARYMIGYLVQLIPFSCTGSTYVHTCMLNQLQVES